MAKKFVLCMICLLVLSACSSEQEIAFDVIYPDTSFNHDITMKLDELLMTEPPLSRKAVVFDIENHSTSRFEYEPNTCCSIYYFDEEQGVWLVVDDLMRRHNYYGGNSVVLPNDNVPHLLGLESYTPSFPGLEVEMMLRFVITGVLFDTTEEQVGAYIDLLVTR